MSKVDTNDLIIPNLEIGEYQHYKGNSYNVVGVGLDSETNQPVVVYSPLSESRPKFWVRPYNMFIEDVEIDGKRTPRFKKV